MNSIQEKYNERKRRKTHSAVAKVRNELKLSLKDHFYSKKEKLCFPLDYKRKENQLKIKIFLLV